MPSGALQLVGVSRTPVDGETIRISPSDDGPERTLEINRTDERDVDGNPASDPVLEPNIGVDITRSTTGSELVGRINNAIQGLDAIAGLTRSDLRVIPGGILSIGGQEGLGIAVTGRSFEVTGEPAVTGASTIEVFGPLLLSLPPQGGGLIASGSVMVLRDAQNQEVFFEFRNNQDQNPPSIPTANFINFSSFDSADVVRDSLITAINAAAIGITAGIGGAGRVSLGRIDDSRVDIDGGTFDVNGDGNVTDDVEQLGINGASLRRGIVSDQEVLTIRQGLIVVNYEFEAANGGGGVAPGNVQVPFTAGSSVIDVASALAAAINGNKNGLVVNAVATSDGRVELNDRPGTIIDVSTAPTLNLIGVPGGATPIRISSAFSSNEIKEALINAINSVNQPGGPALTSLFAEDRGGATFFVSGAAAFDGPVQNYSLPAISDNSGNPLEPNRDDLTTQFTLLLPTVGLDFGDAPDPVSGVSGRYPTRLINDGPRHVVDDQLFLGRFIDTDLDGIPVATADGDDLSISITSTGTLFETLLDGSAAKIIVKGNPLDPTTRDGDTITIDTGVASATFEFDLNGRFDEDNFAISPADPTSVSDIVAALVAAIDQSPLDPANVTSTSATVLIDADDEDGVIFTSPTNPDGVLNKGVATPIEVSVTGAGILEAWIDFNADGDWDDPGEQIIPMPVGSQFDAIRQDLCPVDLTGVASNIFADTGGVSTRGFCIIVPATTPVPPTPVDTYARFRISREGDLKPTGLALSGEVEDYALRLLPGLPPALTNTQANRTFTTAEDVQLQALDAAGNQTQSTTNDDGLLAGVVDSNGDGVEIVAADTGVRTILTPGGTEAGVLDLSSDGRFTFLPEPNFNGAVNFTARVTDVHPLDPSAALINSRPISVTINIAPVNDPPVAQGNDVLVTRTIAEDEVQFFNVADTVIGNVSQGDGLIGNKYLAGPDNEGTQPMVIRSVSSIKGDNLSSLGGLISIIDGGTRLQYTPPSDYQGTIGDTFNYVVADVPSDGSAGEEATKIGTVSITFTAVNDAPRAVNDSYSVPQDTVLVIPQTGTGSVPGILDNDTAGPADENQDLSLVITGFPATTDEGGTVTLVGGNLRYVPPGLFSGVDRFSYQVRDSEGAVGTATVSINLSGVNDTPEFIGVNGNAGIDTITREESKTQAQSDVFDLNTWFRDPDGDTLTFEVTSSNSAVADITLVGSLLTIVYPPFGFGEANLTIKASDPSGAELPQVISVVVNGTPDPPQVSGTLNPLVGTEDQIVTAHLGGVFSDPDNQPLTYSVLRLGATFNPTADQIVQHPLVKSIEFVGEQLRITLEPDQSGSVEIEIAATDGSSQVSDFFQLTVGAIPDSPIAVDDHYLLPVGATLEVVNPSNGLLRNDRDADGDAISVQLETVAGAAATDLTLDANGTFRFQNTTGQIGDEFTLTYRVIDATGQASNTATVTFTLNQSRYQNPLSNLHYTTPESGTLLSPDVTADGFLTALDALRVINFLNRNLPSDALAVPVSDIGAPPPDYYDVNGDGRITSLDALNVVNRLRAINNTINPNGEFIASASTLSGTLASDSITTTAVTSSIVSLDTAGMPSRQMESVDDHATDLDDLLTLGFAIEPVATQPVSGFGDAPDGPAASVTDVDEALTTLFDDPAMEGLTPESWALDDLAVDRPDS